MQNASGTPAALATALGDRYRIVRELGVGGMATVYLAEDIRHARKVAVKVLHPDLAAALGPERFLAEIRTTANLQHPHILSLHDSGEAGGFLFYVMPFVEGETLRARLNRERQIGVGDAVRMAREVADALGYAHARGIIHRDIKPENILLQGGHALVADFGIALAVQSAGGQRMTQTGLSLGTPQYMSPEQAMGERTIDARSDIYALGAVLYEMLIGEAPFTGPTVQAIVARVMSEEPRSLTRQRKAVPFEVESAVLRALEKLPADRFESAQAFADALVTPSTAPRQAPDHLRAVGQSSRRALVVVSAVALLAVFAALWGWLRPPPPPVVVRYRVNLDSQPQTRDAWGQLALSPDGSTIVHTGSPGSPLRIRRRNELSFSDIPGTEGARAPFFSADGTRIGYTDGDKLLVAPLDGGPPVTYVSSLGGPQSYTWSSDGYIYGLWPGARGSPDSAQGQNGTWRMRATPGAVPERITTVDAVTRERYHDSPVPIPGGRGMLLGVSQHDGRRAIAVADLRTGKHTILFPGARAYYTASGHILYSTADNKLFAVPFDAASLEVTGTPVLVSERVRTTIVGPLDFAVSQTGTLVYAYDDAAEERALVWVARDGSIRGSLDSTWREPFIGVSISPDGNRVAVGVRGSSSNIWVKPVAGGPALRLTLEGALSEEPAWTPDGRSVSYVSGGNTSGEVWMKRIDGSAPPVQLLKPARPVSEQTWSSDGRWLVVRTTTPTAGSGDILALRPTMDSMPRPLVASPNSEYTPALSPDGRWMAYSTFEGGRFETFVVPFPDPGSAKWQVSTQGGTSPRWSPRGNELFYLDARLNLMSAEVQTSPTFSVLRTRRLFDASGFVMASLSRRNYDVAPDASRFLMVRRPGGSTTTHLVVVENWFEELKRARGAR